MIPTSTSYPREKIKILLLENISRAATDAFKSAGYTDVSTLSGALSEEQMIEAIQGVHVLGIRSKTRITSRILAAADRLIAIGAFCIGTDQIDLPAATLSGTAVFNSPYSNTRSVAELVIGSAIMLVRKIPDKNAGAHAGRWMKDSKGCNELRGLNIGIVGYGNIGSQVSVLAESFGLRVVFYDVVSKLPLGNATPAESLERLVSESDIVTIHVPAGASTDNLINANTLRLMKAGAVLINYSRGNVVDIESLAESLKLGHLGGAAIDVFPVEPEKQGDAFTSPLQNIPNVLLTPHIGGSTEQAQRNIALDVSGRLVLYLETGSSDGSMSIPPVVLPQQSGTHRILHIHRNVPGVLGEINSTISNLGLNIVGQYLKTTDAVGYVILDFDKELSAEGVDRLKSIDDTIRVRSVY
jgi:D-3-phosphoglycerate dehydrogenase